MYRYSREKTTPLRQRRNQARLLFKPFLLDATPIT
jgi:hypothetical protein